MDLEIKMGSLMDVHTTTRMSSFPSSLEDKAGKCMFVYTHAMSIHFYMHIYFCSICIYWKPWGCIGTSILKEPYTIILAFLIFYVSNSLLHKWETWLLLSPMCLLIYPILFTTSLRALPGHRPTQVFFSAQGSHPARSHATCCTSCLPCLSPDLC